MAIVLKYHEFLSMDYRRRAFALTVASTWNSLTDNVVALETLGNFKRADWKIVSFDLACFVRYFVWLFTSLICCSSVWFVSSAIFFYWIKFYSIKLFIRLFVLFTCCVIVFCIYIYICLGDCTVVVYAVASDS